MITIVRILQEIKIGEPHESERHLGTARCSCYHPNKQKLIVTEQGIEDPNTKQLLILQHQKPLRNSHTLTATDHKGTTYTCHRLGYATNLKTGKPHNLGRWHDTTAHQIILQDNTNGT
jgi:hypothetical protein